jgi:serine/threonine-protein kinase RIM15
LIQWAVGVILYEFLYGTPPFNAATPPEVFENILLRRINWLEDEIVITAGARELMERFMCAEIGDRLGSKGVIEIKRMAWFKDTDWEKLESQKVYFIPTVKSIEDTDYFDSRGAKGNLNLSDDENYDEGSHTSIMETNPSTGLESDSGTDFGEAVYKNISLLEKQNKIMASRISLEHPEGEAWLQRRRDSMPSSQSIRKMSMSPQKSSIPKAFPPRRSTAANMRGSEYSIGQTVQDTISSEVGEISSLQNNLPFSSFSSIMSANPDLAPRIFFEPPNSPIKKGLHSQAYLDVAKRNFFGSFSNDEDELNKKNLAKSCDVLIVESNPVSCKILETILTNLRTRCVSVKNGRGAIQCLMGDIKFDVIFIDSQISDGMRTY